MVATAMTLSKIAEAYVPRKQLARELGERLRGKPLSVFTLIVGERRGEGPPVTRMGRDVLYKVSSVERWLAEQELSADESDTAA